MMFIGLRNWPSATAHTDGGFSLVISFGPNSLETLRRRPPALSPEVVSVPSDAATSAASRANGGGVGDRADRLCEIAAQLRPLRRSPGDRLSAMVHRGNAHWQLVVSTRSSRGPPASRHMPRRRSRRADERAFSTLRMIAFTSCSDALPRAI